MNLKKCFKGIIALTQGHLVVFKHSFKKRVTLEYPEVKSELGDNFRGKHIYNFEKCRACGICQKSCPANAITIIKEDKTLVEYSIDYKKCIFCGNCAFYCPFSAIKMGSEFELATDSAKDLVVSYKKDEDSDE